MKFLASLPAIAIALTFSGAADAHSLRVQCKKLDTSSIVCRFLFTDGEVGRNLGVQLIEENSNKVITSGRTDMEGKYAFKAPADEYNVVVEADKGHVASMSSEDIW